MVGTSTVYSQSAGNLLVCFHCKTGTGLAFMVACHFYGTDLLS